MFLSNYKIRFSLSFQQKYLFSVEQPKDTLCYSISYILALKKYIYHFYANPLQNQMIDPTSIKKLSLFLQEIWVIIL